MAWEGGVVFFLSGTVAVDLISRCVGVISAEASRCRDESRRGIRMRWQMNGEW